MGNAQSYVRNPAGYFVMRKVCLQSDDGTSCVPTEIADRDTGNEFYRIKSPLATSSTYTSSVLHTIDKKHLFYARNALGKTADDAKVMIGEAIVKPLFYFTKHPSDDIYDDSVKEKIKDVVPPPGFCLYVQPCDENFKQYCCAEPDPAQQQASKCTQLIISQSPSADNKHSYKQHAIVLLLLLLLLLLLYCLLVGIVSK